MHDNRSHPLLEQVPLTVSPFVQLPRATTLPYRYKAMPSALPPSIIESPGPGPGSAAGGGGGGKAAYVTSAASGSAAHPDDILASCRALREHVARIQAEADEELRQFEARIQARELAEKRRLAPGWLDSDERLLVPEKREAPAGEQPQPQSHHSEGQLSEMAASEPAGNAPPASSGGVTAEELDRAFGGLQLQR